MLLHPVLFTAGLGVTATSLGACLLGRLIVTTLCTPDVLRPRKLVGWDPGSASPSLPMLNFSTALECGDSRSWGAEGVPGAITSAKH